MQRILFTETNSGLKARFGKKDFFLKYPSKIWKSCPKSYKHILIDNLAHLLTINMPLIAGFKGLFYNTSKPYFKSLFREIVLRSIPHATDDYEESTDSVLDRFDQIKYLFSSDDVKVPKSKAVLKEKAIIPLSMGKDRLLTSAVCKEIGLEPNTVYVNDTVSPTENNLKLKFTKKLCKEQKIPLTHITNHLENLNDFELWDKPETCVGYTHMITGFAFISIPLMHYFNAGYIVLGNQQDMNFPYINKDGYETFPAYDQTSTWTKQLSDAINKMTGGNVMSVIEPLTNIAAMKVLFHRYPDFAKYEISCDCLNASDEPRWCHSCNKCARLSLFIRSVGEDPKVCGFRNLLLKKHKRLYRLFDGKEVDCYERSKEARDQQLLAFYMLYRNKVKEPLVEEFKKKFLSEAIEREDELHNKFFSVHKAKTMPEKIKKKVEKIYQEELEMSKASF